MSKWYSLKELKRARTPMLLDSVTGLPDNHVITVVERVISVDDSELIQNNVRTDTFTLNLDAEYDDLNVVVIFTKPNNINVKVAYNGTPTHIPGSAMELVGSLACSVVGIDADGEVRAVTKAAPDTFQVVKSGAYDGSVTSDDAELLGQILQAVSDTETATTAAETATTAATNATSQATSAATSANQAASSANTAASSANSAATRATSAAVNAENAYETLQPYMATIDSCANILHREVGPDAVVTADDAFPAKPVEMVVYGNTTQNLWVNPNGNSAGVTATSNSDGSVTISGTSTSSGASTIAYTSYTLKPNTQYMLSVDKKVSDSTDKDTATAFSIVERNESGTWIVHHVVGYGSTLSDTFTTTSSFAYVQMRLVVQSGTTVSGTYRVMLNEGSEPQPWCPPGLNSVGQLREDEKNLWVNPDTETKSGVTLTANSDGTITLSGTNTTGVTIQAPVSGLKPNTTYYLDWDRNLPIGYFCVGVNGGATIKSSRGTFTTGSDTSNLVCAFVVASSHGTATFSGTYKVMLNEGSTEQPWVPPESEGCVQVVTAGKNLANAENVVTGNGGTVSNNDNSDGSFDFNITSDGVYAFVREKVTLTPGTYRFSAQLSGSGSAQVILKQNIVAGTNNSFTVNSTNEYELRVVQASSTQGTVHVSGWQLELGSTATDYEPPNITTTPIDLKGHTLNALPDGTRDELHIDGGGNVVLEKRTGIATYDGSSDEGWTYESSTGAIRANPIADCSITSSVDKFMCDVLPVNSLTHWGISVSSSRPSVFDVFGNDASSLTSYLNSRNMRFIYPLAKPQTIDLGTIAPPTMAAPNITAYVADDTPAEMELDYVRDINIVVDRLEKKVADLAVTEATNV